MSTTSIRKEKIDIVKRIASDIDENLLTIFLDYRGLSVAEITGLRRNLRKVDAGAKVAKNTFTRLALKSLNIEYPAEFLIGPTLVIGTKSEFTQAAKAVVQFMSKNKVVNLKGGILEKNCIEKEVIKELSDLPSKEELIAKTVGAIKSPLSGLVIILSSPLRGFINVLNSIKDKKNGGEL